MKDIISTFFIKIITQSKSTHKKSNQKKNIVCCFLTNFSTEFNVTSLFFFEKQILMVCSLFLLSLTSQAFTGFPDIFTLCIKAFSSMVWQSILGMLPWCQLKKPFTYIPVFGLIVREFM